MAGVRCIPRESESDRKTIGAVKFARRARVRTAIRKAVRIGDRCRLSNILRWSDSVGGAGLRREERVVKVQASDRNLGNCWSSTVCVMA